MNIIMNNNNILFASNDINPEIFNKLYALHHT